MYTNEVPRRVIIGFVKNKSFNGDNLSSPFSFNHFKIKSIELLANGRLYPQHPYSLDFDASKYARAYNDMMVLENSLFLNKRF